MDLTASLTLSVPEYEKVGKSVESKLNNILSRHPDLVMETLQEVKASSANTIHNTSVQVYGVSAFVIMFSIFNLTNTLISRISTRRKEFGILESIGMTKKQIKKMLLHESVLLIIPCLIITVVAGTLMGYLLVRILSANGLTYFQYTFPFIPLLIYGVCLIITPIIISAICLKFNAEIRWWNGSKWQTDFEMSERCNISPRFSMKFLAAVTFRGHLGFNTLINKSEEATQWN